MRPLASHSKVASVPRINMNRATAMRVVVGTSMVVLFLLTFGLVHSTSTRHVSSGVTALPSPLHRSDSNELQGKAVDEYPDSPVRRPSSSVGSEPPSLHDEAAASGDDAAKRHPQEPSAGLEAPEVAHLEPEKLTLHDEKGASDGDATISFHFWIMTIGLTVVVLSHDVIHRLRLTSYLSESGAVILLGVCFGWLVMVADKWMDSPKDSLLDAIKFDHSFFVRFVLPAIIFEQGFGMNHHGVIENLEIVLLLAIPGVVVSAAITGTLLFAVSPWGYAPLFEAPGGFFLCFALGALLSATDPVAIVSILRSRFDVVVKPPTLYNIIFGESMLNDAVSIVLFEVALDYVNIDVTIGSATHALAHFVWVLGGSALCGYAHGVLGVWMTRHVRFHAAPHLEVLLQVLIAIASYYMCEFLDLSGIMALFVSARMLGHYGPPFMSAEAQQHAPVIFRTLSSIAESASFFVLGTAFFAYPHTWSPRFCALTIFCCLLSRAVVVRLSARFANEIRSKPITTAAQVFVWYSGMRGAVSFGLVAVLVDHCGLIGVRDDVATLLLSSTLLVIVFTVIVLGGAATHVMEVLGVADEGKVLSDSTRGGEADAALVERGELLGFSPRRVSHSSGPVARAVLLVEKQLHVLADLHTSLIYPLISATTAMTETAGAQTGNKTSGHGSAKDTADLSRRLPRSEAAHR